MRQVSCSLVAWPDGEFGYNAVRLTFGPTATLTTVPQYFRVALQTSVAGTLRAWCRQTPQPTAAVDDRRPEETRVTDDGRKSMHW